MILLQRNRMESVFNILDSRIKHILFSKKIEKPTEPQIKAITPILQGKNVLLIAPTGLGKTESALLPIFHNFLQMKELSSDLEKKDRGISILYITPLRALNRDMLRSINKESKPNLFLCIESTHFCLELT